MLSNEKIWNLIIKSFTKNPRNVLTKPLNKRQGLWFYVKCIDDKVYISSGDKTPASNISGQRLLNKLELFDILNWYRKRGTDSYDSKEVTKCTINCSYWYGIFNDLKIK